MIQIFAESMNEAGDNSWNDCCEFIVDINMNDERMFMKKILALLLQIFRIPVPSKHDTDEETWKHLDGAEFYTVLPEKKIPLPTK